MAQARQYPGQERQFFEFVQQNQQMQQQLRAPIFEDKVVERPPSTVRICPVMNPDGFGGQELHRLGHLGGPAMRFIGVWSRMSARKSTLSFSVSFSEADMTEPKATAFTRMRCGASATASDRVIWSSAAEHRIPQQAPDGCAAPRSTRG